MSTAKRAKRTGPQCSVRVGRPMGVSTIFGQCLNAGTVQVGDLWYCGTHAPEGKAARKAKAEGRAERSEAWIEARRQHHHAAVAVLRSALAGNRGDALDAAVDELEAAAEACRRADAALKAHGEDPLAYQRDVSRLYLSPAALERAE